ncbi:MAG: hypothetical protein KF768_01230 [Phycisphaeraceae bacterium]|nr:hypothetical protein [Phycisphaeraceae bacterium]
MPRPPAKRALAIGGTGMLRGVCVHLAGLCESTVVLARSRAGLEQTAQLAAPHTHRIRSIAADYSDAPTFTALLRNHVDAHGRFDLAVCWIHAHSARPALQSVLEVMAERSRVVHVVGSASRDSSEPALAPEHRESLISSQIAYQRVLLGFVIEPAGSRWLTHDEISHGVISAIEGPPEDSTIGTLSPWDERP